MVKLAEDVIESLELLKYPQVESLLTKGTPNNLSLLEFSAIVHWLTDELNDMLHHDYIVNELSSEAELDAFKIELNSLLRGLQSPLTGCDLKVDTNRLAILNCLCGELMASRILFVNKPADGSMKIDMNESETAKDLKTSMIILGIGKPPANVQSSQLFSKMKEKINEKLKKSTLASEEPLLLKDGTQFVPKEWNVLNRINTALFEDYNIRRQTLITRCDCTIGSFKWKEGEKKDTCLSEKIETAYGKLRTILDPKPNVSLAHALAARKSGCFELLNSVVSKSHQICDIETPKTKGMANVGKQQRISLQKFLIGHVPDRGGRPQEQPPVPQETFQQQQNQRQQPRGGGNQRGGYQQHSQQRNQPFGDSAGQRQQRNQSYGDAGGQYQQRHQSYEDNRGQHSQRDHSDQSYHQQQPRQYYSDKSYHSSNHPRGQYQDDYQQSGYQQPHHNQSYDNPRGGHRGGGRGGRGGYQDHGRGGGGRVQGAGWNQGYQRY
ncbi:protein FAM98A isoform X1 [Tetranychus urticae]|uniref:Protein FAM98A n=1 Tax=Tetranychus urticae TaxID=32264 RepID=T1JSA0_TETUR|nr:protein FAM98A isoform X1 [Tetranychus urticae]